ncbi:putative transcriptional regulator SLK1 [Sesamum alatum]|uniref:Transcriptional regulator SLK1 n=1 Tax=Sesamum alatum TaxID=300844 RepID=A0AAE2CUR8_9LAMI|nr:putative transcriptional regulator SLK1 [Sesamum alatum]
MALEDFMDSNSQLPIPLILPVNGAGGMLGALSSHNSLVNAEDLDSILGMAQLNTNLNPDVMNATIVGKSSTSRSPVCHDAGLSVANLIFPTGPYLQSHGNTNMEPYVTLSSSPMSFSGDNPVNVVSQDDAFSRLFHGGQKERKRQEFRNTTGFTDFYKSKLQTHRDSFPLRIKEEPSTLTPIPKKPKLYVKQENIQQQQQQQIIQELLLKELQDRNPQLKGMIKLQRQKNQLQQPILHTAPQIRGYVQLPKQLQEQQMISLMQNQGNQQGPRVPFLDAGICSRRFMQYLYHLRNHTHDNDISYWKKFVSEYYAPDSKKRWCFSTYENIDLHGAGVFCSKSMETWCCDICGSRPGKGLEATFDILPRLFKVKFESGMLDEILFLDLPRACQIPSGLVLEYGKAIQESVYEKFRVVHEGKLRIVFRYDLKILSWEFCAQSHEEYLLRRLVAPQVNQLVQAAKKCQKDIQNGASSRVSAEVLRKNCNMFVSAGNQLARHMELPLVNDLGYSKRFIRCLQIAEVVDSMKDLMSFSQGTKMGPIECLNSYSQGSKIGNWKETRGMELFTGAENLPAFPQQPHPRSHANGYRMSENDLMSSSGSSGLALFDLNHQLLRQTSSTPALRRNGHGSSLSDHPNQAMVFAQSVNSNQHNAPAYILPGSQSSQHGKNPHQSLVDKLLQEMAAANRGKSMQEPYGKLNNAHRSNQKRATSNETMHFAESSNAAFAQVILADASRAAAPNFSQSASYRDISTVGQNAAVKAEPYSPEQLQEAFQGSATTLSKLEDLQW